MLAALGGLVAGFVVCVLGPSLHLAEHSQSKRGGGSAVSEREEGALEAERARRSSWPLAYQKVGGGRGVGQG